MKKDFDKWNKRKKRLDSTSARPFFHEREMWWCSLGVNIGYEQDGGGRDFLRPVIVFKKFNNEIFWAVPLTHTKKDTKHYFHFVIEGVQSAAILSQIRLVDTSRLSHKLGNFPRTDFEELTKKFKALLP